MNAIDEIKKMKEDFRLAKTPEALAEMDKRMADLVASKTETERKELRELLPYHLTPLNSIYRS